MRLRAGGALLAAGLVGALRGVARGGAVLRAGAARRLGAERVVELVGYTDRSGADRYNQALSERRAMAVRNYFGGQGVVVQQMTSIGKGETDPRVPTPDGVREQENRRVEIRLR